jgi:hypothetical protein
MAANLIASTDWKEEPAPGEAERFERYGEQLRDLQRKLARGKNAARALHAKGFGLEAEFEVLDGLPAQAQVALFARPARYRAYVRFSNGSPHRNPDRKPDIRGVAIKLLGVEGKKLIPGMEDAKTQDFLLVRSRSGPFRSPGELVQFALLGAQPWRLPVAIGNVGLGRFLEIAKGLKAEFSQPLRSLAATTYFGPAPIQFGPYAVRCSLVPETEGAPLPGKTPEFLTEELSARLRNGPVRYAFRVQFFVDAARTPIEDSSVDWPESVSPFVTVGRLTLLQQDPASARGQALSTFVEKLSFDPWHALVELKPLGAAMRARNHAYRLSGIERGAAPEPDGSETVG